MSDTPRTDEEIFEHPSGYEVVISELAYQLERELTSVTEQRDAVTLRLGNTQERMFNAERQRDRLAEAVNAATILIAAKGRHNTMLAYEGLLAAIQSLTPNEL
jgi:hypothetical protein